MRAILILAAMAVLARPAQAQSAKEKYELQMLCGKQAAERFAKDRDQDIIDDSGGARSEYENHYNARLNKCIYLLTTMLASRDRSFLKVMTLFDINENREIARFAFGQTELLSCWLQEKASLPQSNCRTEQEWRQLIKPFMEE